MGDSLKIGIISLQLKVEDTTVEPWTMRIYSVEAFSVIKYKHIVIFQYRLMTTYESFMIEH